MHMMYRNWISRRVAYTNEVIAFAKVGEQTLLDAIPLAEVTSIEPMLNSEQNSTEKSTSESTFEVAVENSNAMQIRTIKNGHNAGRKYYLQASSAQELDDLVSELRLLTKSATERAEASSKWNKLQERVRLVYNSSWFQGVAALLIIAVRAAANPLLSPLARAAASAGELEPPSSPSPLPQNFVVSVAEAQLSPERLQEGDGSPTRIKRSLDALNLAFTVIFTFELFANLLSNWLRPFLANSWSAHIIVYIAHIIYSTYKYI
jgi:hypothetical protein